MGFFVVGGGVPESEIEGIGVKNGEEECGIEGDLGKLNSGGSSLLPPNSGNVKKMDNGEKMIKLLPESKIGGIGVIIEEEECGIDGEFGNLKSGGSSLLPPNVGLLQNSDFGEKMMNRAQTDNRTFADLFKMNRGHKLENSNWHNGGRSFAELFKINRGHRMESKLAFTKQPEGNWELPGEKFTSVYETHGHCLVGNAIGRRINVAMVKQLVRKWGMEVPFKMYDFGWVSFKFQSEEDMFKVLNGGPYIMAGSYFCLKPIPPLFSFSREDLIKMPSWVQIYGLPQEGWNLEILGLVASWIGVPVQADLMTLMRLKHSFARVLVEVDISKERMREADVKFPDGSKRKIRFIYEVEKKFCSKCGMMGHLANQCSVGMPKKPVNVPQIWKYVAKKDGNKGEKSFDDNGLKNGSEACGDGEKEKAPAEEGCDVGEGKEGVELREGNTLTEGEVEGNKIVVIEEEPVVGIVGFSGEDSEEHCGGNEKEEKHGEDEVEDEGVVVNGLEMVIINSNMSPIQEEVINLGKGDDELVEGDNKFKKRKGKGKMEEMLDEGGPFLLRTPNMSTRMNNMRIEGSCLSNKEAEKMMKENFKEEKMENKTLPRRRPKGASKTNK